MTDKNHIKHVNGRWGRCAFFEKDAFIGKSLQHYGEYAPDETEFILALAQKAGKEKTVLDIGANIGAISQALEHSGFTVQAFEPQPEVYALLTQNFKGTAHNIALGAAPGTTVMPRLNYDEVGNFGGVSCGTASRSRGAIEIPVRTLDSFNFDNIGLMKIDVEGYETQVLQGAVDTIKRCSPVLYLEDDRIEKRQALHAMLNDLGYKWQSHTPPLFRAANFLGHAENIWDKNFVSHNLVCYR